MNKEYNTVAEELEAMIAQNHEDTTDTNIEVDTEIDIDTGVEDNYVEDTSHNEEGTDGNIEIDTTLDHDGDVEGDDVDGDEGTEDVDEGNTQTGDEDENGLEGSNDDTELEDADGQASTTDEINYKEEYERLRDFYDKVTGEFTANGRKVKGFNDPDKIIQGLQKAIGFEEKAAAIKEYKKFLAPLRDNGFIDNPEKFELAISIMNGDKEAIKKHIKDLDINPITDLDIDDGIKYERKKIIPSDPELLLSEEIEMAGRYGEDVAEKLQDALREFDNDSFNRYMKVPKVREVLRTHIADGTYDLVKERVEELKFTDINGEFKQARFVDQYDYALKQIVDELTEERLKSQPAVKPAQAKPKVADANIVPKQEPVKVNAIKDREAEEARRAAASLSAKKPPVKKAVVDPLEELKGEDFKKYFNSLMMG